MVTPLPYPTIVFEKAIRARKWIAKTNLARLSDDAETVRSFEAGERAKVGAVFASSPLSSFRRGASSKRRLLGHELDEKGATQTTRHTLLAPQAR